MHRKPDSSNAVTSLPGRMESDRPSTGTRLLRSAENRYHPHQVQRSSRESRINAIMGRYAVHFGAVWVGIAHHGERRRVGQ